MTDQGPPKGEAFETARGLFLACKEVETFIRETVLPQFSDEKLSDDVSGMFYGQLLRAYAWIHTITKLDEPFDFQAVAAGARALLETAIDMVLLRANPSDVARVVAWEESERFKHAQAIERYYQALSAPPVGHEPAVQFAKGMKARIERLRLRQGWKSKNGKARHPDRWTGRHLDEDAKRADDCGHTFKFSNFYETEYRQVCWMVHGSGFVHRRVSAEFFPAIGGMLYRPCADLATLCAELAIRQVLGWSATHEAAFGDLRTRTILVAGVNRRLAMGEAPFPEVPRR
ncbi:MAG: hypothetical protein JXP73_10200 [Deltaproteobacteria bacterium]|nr:hypothetical protein [Deltaproteobacteria bacterium]